MSKNDNTYNEPDIEVGVNPVQQAPPPSMVTVIAPSNLQAGYTFTAQVDGKNFIVTVPQGGVEAGQRFDVPYPTSTSTTVVTTMAGTQQGAAAVGGGYSAPPTYPSSLDNPQQHNKESLAPRGRWRNGLCDCIEVCCCTGMCCQACCCIGILVGQLAQRFHLDFMGNPIHGGNVPGNQNQAFSTWTVIWGVYMLLLFCGLGVFGEIMTIFLAIVIMNIRYAMRKHYEIQPSCCDCCDGKFDDFCCGCCCSCCVTIQMARHTHDHHIYRYMCCEPTGLPVGTPECV